MGKSNKKSGKYGPGNRTYKEEVETYLRRWPWFLFWVSLCVGAGYLYLRYATPTYRASASIIINDENGKNGGGQVNYGDMAGMTGLVANSMDREIAVLNSRKIMTEVVRALNLNIQYFKPGKVREIELYEDVPFLVRVLKINEAGLKKVAGERFSVSLNANKDFIISNTITGKTFSAPAETPVDLGFADVVLELKPGEKDFSEIMIQFTTIEKMTSRYRGRIVVKPVEAKSNVLIVSLEDPVKQKAKDILDQLIFEYNRDAIEDKNLVAGNTANFINERLDIINGELEQVETGKEEFKESNRLTDIQAESRMYVQNASEYNKQRQEIGTQLELTNAMLDYLTNSSNSELLPANLGIQENGVNNQINEYNNLVLERNRILTVSTDKNPVVVRLNSRIDQIKAGILQSLQRLRSNLRIALDDINRQSSSIGSRILAVPSQEREYRGIERQQSIKEALYLFLLQKREENSLALALTAPKAKIVDRAYSSGGIVSPNSRSIYLGTLFLGLFVPFSLIYVKGLLDTKVRKRADVDKLKGIPFLGELPRVRKKEMLIGENDRSVLAESFRILITNLQYLQVNFKERGGGRVILVTSTVKGEGKTFTSVNLGISLANTGKKVLLIGADLRNPKLHSFIGGKDLILGVSDYLVGNSTCLRSLIRSSILHPELDILASGSIPPNPAELLRLEKAGAMLAELKQEYDYVIIDSAPSMLVTDTLLISRYADLTLYLVRAGYTDKQLIEFAVDSKEAGSFHNMGLILTDVDLTSLGYGNKYGYGYGKERKRFWARNRSLRRVGAL